MNREQIISWAREAGFSMHDGIITGGVTDLERFAAIVAAAERESWPAEMEAMERQVNILTDERARAKADEREACAKVADEADKYNRHISREIANAIRARGQS